MPYSDPPDREAIARAIKAARDARQWTQEDVQYALRSRGAEHDSLGTVKRWETIGSIQLVDALMLASIYEMTLEELLSMAPDQAISDRFRHDGR